jgi:hypothetical protein
MAALAQEARTILGCLLGDDLRKTPTGYSASVGAAAIMMMNRFGASYLDAQNKELDVRNFLGPPD